MILTKLHKFDVLYFNHESPATQQNSYSISHIHELHTVTTQRADSDDIVTILPADVNGDKRVTV